MAIYNIIPLTNLLNKIEEPTSTNKIVGHTFIRNLIFIVGAAGVVFGLFIDGHSTFDRPRLLFPIIVACASWFTLVIAAMSNINRAQKRKNIKPEMYKLLELLTGEVIHENDFVLFNIYTGNVKVIQSNNSSEYKRALEDNYVALAHLSSLKTFKLFKIILSPYFKLFKQDPEIYISTVIIQFLSLLPIGAGIALAFVDPENWDDYIKPALGLVLGSLLIAYIFELLSDLTNYAEIRLFNYAIEAAGGKDFYDHEAAIDNEILNSKKAIKYIKKIGADKWPLNVKAVPITGTLPMPQSTQPGLRTTSNTLNDSSSTSQSTNIVPSNSFTQPRIPPKTPLHDVSRIKNLLQRDCHIPDHFQLEAAIGAGDCFFDAVAQGLNQLRSSECADVKSLRSFCDAYAKDPKNTWVKTAVIGDHQDFDQYLVRIGLTVGEMEIAEWNTKKEPVVWGRTEIEGRMICDLYGVKLHVIEVHDEEEDHELRVMEQRVDNQRAYSVGPMIETDYDDAHTIHLVVYKDHFVPLLSITPRLIHTQQPTQSAESSLSSRNTPITNRYIRSYSHSDRSNNNANYYSLSINRSQGG